MKDKQQLMGYSFSKGWEYITLHIEKYRFLMKTYISPNINLFQKIIITLDFMVCVLKYGTGINDYFQYNFYKRRSVDRKSFIVARNRKKIIKKCNGTIEHLDFDNKSQFNKLFESYLMRDWIDLDKHTFEDFLDFVNRHERFICKIKNGSGGNGVRILSAQENDLKQLYDELRTEHVILEEILLQHPDMEKFNPASVNTLRVITLKTANDVKIMNAVFRCGNGEGCTDNFHHFGLAALIDIDTGIVITPAVDKLNYKYFLHPRTQQQIIGFRIPCWNQVIDVVKKASMVCPNVRFVGWDIVICKSGDIAIVEGNCAADPDITQMPDQIGKWPVYKSMIESLG